VEKFLGKMEAGKGLIGETKKRLHRAGVTAYGIQGGRDFFGKTLAGLGFFAKKGIRAEGFWFLKIRESRLELGWSQDYLAKVNCV